MAKRFAFLTTVFLFLGLSLGLQAQDEASAAELYNKGLEKLKAKEYGEALPLMNKAVEAADPENETDAQVIKLAKKNGTIAAYKHGTALRKDDDAEGALAAYDMGIALNPGFYANYIGRAQALEDLGQVTESVKAYINAGDISKKVNKPDKAETMYSKAENVVALAWGEKKWNEAAEYGMAFLELKSSPEVHYYVSGALKEKGEPAKAVEHADKAIELAAGKDDDKYYFVKAESLEALGQTNAAVEAYKQVSDTKYLERAKYKINELEGGK